ncbi:ACT domain-containing protein [Streptomyces sp. NPDC019990]|uniref:ACT domain-containing protein n=1 Tax=Streptomyces sp. NPDC019990 TaxID=3154693 RepID=UPI0033D4B362
MTQLDEVIASSPYELADSTFWMVRSEDAAADAGTRWGDFDDGLENTRVIASPKPPAGEDDLYGPLRAFRLRVSKPFAAPGFLAAACTAVADRDIAVLVISTFTYDYVFVRAERVADAEAALRERGFRASV